MDAPPPTTPPAHWYPDPSNAAQLRYWDGLAWTGHVQPIAPSVPPPPWQSQGQAQWPAANPAPKHGPDDAMHWLLPVGRSAESFAAGYMGLACVLLFWTGPVVILLAIATVLVSIRALKKAKTGGHGTGRAITGLVAAPIGAILGVAYMWTWFA